MRILVINKYPNHTNCQKSKKKNGRYGAYDVPTRCTRNTRRSYGVLPRINTKDQPSFRINTRYTQISVVYTLELLKLHDFWVKWGRNQDPRASYPIHKQRHVGAARRVSWMLPDVSSAFSRLFLQRLQSYSSH